ncbi:MAG: DNA polymerase IV [Coriobacteriia bacterium]|nr:DNA polymerase IV [Coriobacteriia bacterium]MBS5479306.1 DNA polymerase IV [Coriobacteriia bacterium]
MDETHHIESGQWVGPAVGLLDLDAFFASVEQLDHPEWRGKPVIVGGDAERRGVVSTASYEARRFGVHSAMPSAQARRLCPDAIWTNGHFDRYREMSARVMAILGDETPYVEQVSIDEAFFDVTPGRFAGEGPVDIVRRVCSRVAELGVTCSVGLSTNKTCAKIASERNKPNGITVVYPGTEAAFLAPMSVRAMSGVGPSTEATLAKLGIHTLGQLAAADPHELESRLGVLGPRLVVRASGREVSHVAERAAPDDVKSVSNERTFSEDLTDEGDISAAISYLSSVVARRLRRKGLRGHVVTLKVTYRVGESRTARHGVTGLTDDEHVIASCARSLLPGLWAPGMPIRLMGVGVSQFEAHDTVQPSLFDDVEAQEGARQRSDALARATDSLRERFGDAALMYGSELRFRERVSNTAPQHKDDA